MAPFASTALLTALISLLLPAAAQSCIPLKGSTQCPAFNSSSFSTDSTLSSLYPFLAFVSTTQQFDTQLSQYINSSYVQQKYQQLLGCGNINLANTTNLYARYTTSVICNAIVQNSIKPCALSSADSAPLCAESCAQQATNEEEIAVNSQLCASPRSGYLDQIRADFTNCALPSNSLSGTCITGEQNEPNECGFSTNLQGLCSYCATSSPNATDTCCEESNVNSRCPGVTLPTFTSIPPLFPSSTSTSTSSSTPIAPASSGVASSNSHHSSGLSKGAIAGIVIGSVIGAALLAGLLLLCCIVFRRRRRGSQTTVFNQPTPQQKNGSAMVYAPQPASQALPQDYRPQPGGRVARMSALEGSTSDSPLYGHPALGGFGEGSNRRLGDTSDAEAYGEAPDSRRGIGPPTTGRRNGSLSSQSVLGPREDPSSPNTEGQLSSPEGVASGQSEQLPFFKDYYSEDNIQPNDKVSTLWAYSPRAADEFELERGDMLRVVGIWDDGWATGVRISERAEDYDGKHPGQRDSGVSNGSGRGDSPPPSGELKAFPLVCVCLPEYWRQTVEGDNSSESGMTNPPHGFGL